MTNTRRLIKFRYIWKSLKTHQFHKKEFTLAEISHASLRALDNSLTIRHDCVLIADNLQFTGLTDKNGVDIYEDDIIKVVYSPCSNEFKTQLNPTIDSVTFDAYDDGEYVFNVVTWMVGGVPISDGGGGYGLPPYIIEVIGNLYENPDTIKDNS